MININILNSTKYKFIDINILNSIKYKFININILNSIRINGMQGHDLYNNFCLVSHKNTFPRELDRRPEKHRGKRKGSVPPLTNRIQRNFHLNAGRPFVPVICRCSCSREKPADSWRSSICRATNNNKRNGEKTPKRISEREQMREKYHVHASK